MKRPVKTLLCLLLLAAFGPGLLFGCAGKPSATQMAAGPDWRSLSVLRQVPLQHAAQFSLTVYDQGYTLLDIPASGRFLIIPEGAGLPEGAPDDIVPLYGPLDRIYLAATSSMDFFRALDRVSAVRLSAPMPTAGTFRRRRMPWPGATWSLPANTVLRITS